MNKDNVLKLLDAIEDLMHHVINMDAYSDEDKNEYPVISRLDKAMAAVRKEINSLKE